MTFESVLSKFDSDLASCVSKCDTRLVSLIDDLIKQASSAQTDPSSASSTFDRVLAALSVGIGDSKTGLYGEFISCITNVTESASKEINRISASLDITTQDQLDDINSEVESLSDHISSSTTTASTHVSDFVTSENERFMDKFSSIQNSTAHFFITSSVDKCVASISRAEAVLKQDVDRLISLISQYNSIPTAFYDESDLILTDCIGKYNDSLSSAFDVFNVSLAGYKYFTSSSQSEINKGQSLIDSTVSSSSVRVSSFLSSANSALVSLSNRVEDSAISRRLVLDLAFSRAMADIGNKTFTESFRVKTSVISLISRLSSDALVVMSAIDNYYRNAYVSSFVDGSSYRNVRTGVINGAGKIASDAINNMYDSYNNETSTLSSSFTNYLNDSQNSVVDYVNKNSSGITQDQLDLLISKLSGIVSSNSSRVSSYMSSGVSNVKYIGDGISAHLDKMTDRYFNSLPLLRFEGTYGSPAFISGTDFHLADDGVTKLHHNVFSFTISNIGKSSWVGWFGIKLVSLIDATEYSSLYLSNTGEEYTGDYVVPYFLWNKRVGFHTILPGETKSIEICVPGSKIFNIKELGYGVSWSVVVNTHKGVSPLLLKN